MRRLITIPVSHFCEKARWVLDWAGLPFEEDAHVQLVHYLWSYPAARTPFVPILIDGDRVVADSTAILHHVDAGLGEDRRLFPSDPSIRADVERLEERFDVELGPPARAWAYWEWFPKLRALLPYVVQGTPRIEQALAPFLIGGVKKFISWRLDIDVAKAKRALDRVSAVFDDVGLLLADRRRYLAGDRFSAADLTFASLAAPVLLPPEYGVPMPSLDDAPPALRDQMLRFRSTPAGAFALRMYADHRSVSKAAATAGSTMHSAAERGADSAGTATAPELPR